MDKQKLINLINRSDKLDVIVIPSIANQQQIDDHLKKIKDELRRGTGREQILVRIPSK